MTGNGAQGVREMRVPEKASPQFEPCVSPNSSICLFLTVPVLWAGVKGLTLIMSPASLGTPHPWAAPLFLGAVGDARVAQNFLLVSRKLEKYRVGFRVAVEWGTGPDPPDVTDSEAIPCSMPDQHPCSPLFSPQVWVDSPSPPISFWALLGLL